MHSPLRLPAQLAATIFFIFCAISVSAQPAWVTQAMATGTNIQTHKDAKALVLLGENHTRVGVDGRALTHVRIATRILKSDASDHADLSEVVYPWRAVKNLDGWLVTPDGKTKKLDKSYVGKVAVTADAGCYEDDMLLVATWPAVPAGSVAAFEYDIDEMTEWGSTFQAFAFQVQEPVVQATFSVELPPGWQLQSSPQWMDGATYTQNGATHEWRMNDLPYRSTEPLMPSWNRTARILRVNCFGPAKKLSCFADWQAVAKFVAEIENPQAGADSAIKSFVAQQVVNLPTAAEKAAAIVDFMQREIRYVAVEIGRGRIVPRPAGKTYGFRYGDCKDKTALMRAMLTEAGIPSAAVLASAGPLVSPELPTPFQFNHVIVGIPANAFGDVEYPAATAGGWLFFDPTDEYTPLGWLPPSLKDSWVLVGAPIDSPLIKLPPLEPQNFKRRYHAVVELGCDGSIQASVRITDHDGWGHLTARKWKLLDPIRELEGIKKMFSGRLQQPVISDYVTGSDQDSAWVTFRLTAAKYLQLTGDMSLLKLDLFHDDVNGTLRASTREHPVWLGWPMDVGTSVEWRLPPELAIESVTDSLTGSCAIAELSCRCIATEGGLTYQTVDIQRGGEIGPDAYADAQAYYKSFEKATGLRAVLKKRQG